MKFAPKPQNQSFDARNQYLFLLIDKNNIYDDLNSSSVQGFYISFYSYDLSLLHDPNVKQESEPEHFGKFINNFKNIKFNLNFQGP
jgi:hypothetical protein